MLFLTHNGSRPKKVKAKTKKDHHEPYMEDPKPETLNAAEMTWAKLAGDVYFVATATGICEVVEEEVLPKNRGKGLGFRVRRGNKGDYHRGH